jgi:hypothetical protein
MTYAAPKETLAPKKVIKAVRPLPRMDKALVRRLQLAASGRSGVNLAEMTPEEIDARLFG